MVEQCMCKHTCLNDNMRDTKEYVTVGNYFFLIVIYFKEVLPFRHMRTWPGSHMPLLRVAI